MSNEAASLRARAEAVMQVANAHLIARFGDAFERAISIGVNGSYARDELTTVSDIDYCVFFACSDGALRNLNLSRVIADLHAHVRGALPDEPLALRFSVFWSCFQDLSIGGCHSGRLPPYDRGLFRDHGKHVAGIRFDRSAIRDPSDFEVGQAGVRFLLDEVRPQLTALGLFQAKTAIAPSLVSKLGAVLTSKAILMPLRLLYTLLPESRQRRFVGAEAAVNACRDRYSSQRFWPLAEQALRWRASFPEDNDGLTQVAAALGAVGRDVYRVCVEEHLSFALRNDMTAAALELASWRAELTS